MTEAEMFIKNFPNLLNEAKRNQKIRKKLNPKNNVRVIKAPKPLPPNVIKGPWK